MLSFARAAVLNSNNTCNLACFLRPDAIVGRKAPKLATFRSLHLYSPRITYLRWWQRN